MHPQVLPGMIVLTGLYFFFSAFSAFSDAEFSCVSYEFFFCYF